MTLCGCSARMGTAFECWKNHFEVAGFPGACRTPPILFDFTETKAGFHHRIFQPTLNGFSSSMMPTNKCGAGGTGTFVPRGETSRVAIRTLQAQLLRYWNQTLPFSGISGELAGSFSRGTGGSLRLTSPELGYGIADRI
jgi:hypothetical protein